jgi:hypothetical protein
MGGPLRVAVLDAPMILSGQNHPTTTTTTRAHQIHAHHPRRRITIGVELPAHVDDGTHDHAHVNPADRCTGSKFLNALGIAVVRGPPGAERDRFRVWADRRLDISGSPASAPPETASSSSCLT